MCIWWLRCIAKIVTTIFALFQTAGSGNLYGSVFSCVCSCCLMHRGTGEYVCLRYWHRLFVIFLFLGIILLSSRIAMWGICQGAFVMPRKGLLTFFCMCLKASHRPVVFMWEETFVPRRRILVEKKKMCKILRALPLLAYMNSSLW